MSLDSTPKPSASVSAAYRNPPKAAGRVHALIDGHITTEKSRRALARLPEALEVDPEAVDRAVEDTRDFLAHMERHAEEKRRIAPGGRGTCRWEPPSSLMP